MTIRHATARKLLYEWHSGQWSPFYAAASSGLVRSFTELADECTRIEDPDRRKLMDYITQQQQRAPVVTARDGRQYQALPWAEV